jgi:hypothetical protein
MNKTGDRRKMFKTRANCGKLIEQLLSTFSASSQALLWVKLRYV